MAECNTQTKINTHYWEKLKETYGSVKNSHYTGKVTQAVTAVKNFPYGAKTLESVAAIKNVPGARYGLMTGKKLSSSCRAGVYDLKAKTWALRFDMPHHGMKFPHININHKLTGVRDPHIKIPTGAVKTGEVATKSAQTVGEIAFVSALFIDSYRIAKSYYDDYQESNSLVPGKNTAKTGASVAGAWSGGYAGATAGNLTGSLVGSLVGSIFGPVGAVTGASACSLLFTVIGGFAGGIGASIIAESAVNECIAKETYDGPEKKKE